MQPLCPNKGAEGARVFASIALPTLPTRYLCLRLGKLDFKGPYQTSELKTRPATTFSSFAAVSEPQDVYASMNISGLVCRTAIGRLC